MERPTLPQEGTYARRPRFIEESEKIQIPITLSCFSLLAFLNKISQQTVAAGGISIGNHIRNSLLRPDQHHDIPGAGDGGIQKIARHYHIIALGERDYHDGEFAALRFMYAYGVRRLYLVERTLGIFRRFAVLERDGFSRRVL